MVLWDSANAITNGLPWMWMKSMTQTQHIPTIYGTSGMVLNQVYYQVNHIYSNPQNDGNVKFQSQDNMEAVRSFGGSLLPNNTK
jgi:hypothetical protein